MRGARVKPDSPFDRGFTSIEELKSRCEADKTTENDERTRSAEGTPVHESVTHRDTPETMQDDHEDAPGRQR